jgi:hypothetical protein
VIRRWFLLDLRRRWRSLVVLTLLVAFASGSVMTALAGARRGDSALDRLLADTLPADVVALPNEPGFDWDAIRALPEVAALTGFAVTDYRIDEFDDLPFAIGTWFPSTDSEVFDTIERPVVFEGRIPDPSRADEVVVSPNFVSSFDLGVGDTVTLHLFTPEQIDATVSGDLGAPAGPRIPATIVGVVRSPWFSDKVGQDAGAVVPSPGLFPAYERNFLGSEGSSGYVNALIRLHGGAADIPRFKEDLARVTGRADIDVWDLSEWQEHTRGVAGFEADGLTVFSLAAAVAALFIVGQAVVRHVTSTLGDLEPLRAVGMTPAETHAAVLLGPATAGLAGWALGSAAALVASRWFPIGTASLLEPAPGGQVDLVVLGIGFAVTVNLAAGGTWLMSVMTLRRQASTAARRSAIAGAAVRAGLPAPMVVGSRFALEPGRGRHAVPVRPALFGATIGVLGVLAALTFSHGIDDAVGNPERFGITYEFGAFVGFNGFDFADTASVVAAVAADPDVVAVNDTRMDVAQVNDVAVSMFAIDPADRPVTLVFTSGRAPTGTGEVALAPTTADSAGLRIGDTALFAGPTGTRELTVTGIAFVPAGPHNDYDSGGWMTREAYDILFDGHKFHFLLIDLRDGADIAAATERIAGLGIPLEPPQAPTQVAELRQVRVMPLFLAAFLVVLALGAIGHALSTAVRRRSHDVAVLRAVGMSRTQSRLIVATQATILGGVGLVAGIPLGLALGRTVWRYVAERTPLLYLAPSEVLVLIVLVPIALLAANLLAVVPSRRAARLQLAQALRAE